MKVLSLPLVVLERVTALATQKGYISLRLLFRHTHPSSAPLALRHPT